MKNLFKEAVNALSDCLIDLKYRLEENPCEPQISCLEAARIIDDIHSIIDHLVKARDMLDCLNEDDLCEDLFSEETGAAISKALESTGDAVTSMYKIDGVFLRDI